MRCNSSGVNACGGDIGGGESVHWLLGYWLEERSLALTRLPALDLTLAAGEGALHPPACYCTQRSHLEMTSTTA